ncbi:helix-turn-helix domain-containing protein [Nocardia alni]|uniref:helix-turn-helix domain-containing protein n=1 Tax=Nocardia alni TaxID=2815723 RepID=UPI0027E0A383|nr:helix-turn-helix domain-containing protein [Nocardia alni]
MQATLPLYQERRSRAIDGAVVWTRTIGATEAAPVLPDGCIDLLWIGERLVVAGPDTRAYQAAIAPGARIAGIRFFPGTAPTLLAVPAHELLDRRVDLADLWGAARVRHLTAAVASASDPVAALELIAVRRAAETGPADPALRAVVRRLAAGASVAGAADTLGLTERTLRRMSLSAFGYGPKMLARILRLQHVLALARSGTPFAETAFRAGYADQAHMSREVRELSGMPLGRLISRDG